MLNTADTQVHLPSAPSNPVIVTEDLLRVHGCHGFSLEPIRGVWKARGGGFSSGRFLICAATEAFALRVESGKPGSLFVLPWNSSGSLLQNGWEIPRDGFGFCHSGSPVVLHAKGPLEFALVWVSGSNKGAFCNSKPTVYSNGPERKISIDADGDTLVERIEHLVGELKGFFTDGSHAEPNGSLTTQPRRLASRLSVVLDAWEQFDAKMDGDFQMPGIAGRSDISSRTLEYSFHEIVGRPPIAFLRAMRLNRARLLLLRGEVSTVKEAATLCGLRHFGRFSVDYRIQFGEQARAALKTNKAARAAGVMAAT